MIYYVFSVRDKKLQAYGQPVHRVEDVEHVTEMTVRSLKDIPLQERAKAADSALYFLGTFDDIKGKYDLLEIPEKLLDYEDYVPRKEDIVNGKA